MRAPHPSPVVAEAARALTDESMTDYVDMVIGSPRPDRFHVSSVGGAVEFRRILAPGEDGVDRYRYEVDHVEGDDPIAADDPTRFVGLDAELAHLHPTRDTNAYPHAHDQIAQFFDSPHAPDLVVQHTAGHRYGTNAGEHGSLGVVQARAPFIASGAGVSALGRLERSARMIDVAPTVMRLLGGAPHPASIGPTGAPRHDGLLARQDGDALSDVVEHGGARHVVVFLLDGCNANVLYDAIATGGAPTIATLAATGTTMGHGLLASLPTATLANHTTASTGAHPGHSGVVHNMWHDRARGATPDLLAMDQMFDAMIHLSPTVETLHQAVHRNRPDALTAALFEFCDTGADVSSFAEFRRGHPPALPDASRLADASAEFVEAFGAYSFMSSVDELATRQAVELWQRGDRRPDLTFLSLALTDEAGHEGGPHSPMARAAIADSDHRIERVVGAVDAAGASADTAFLVIADHGMEVSDPASAEPWSDVMSRVAGVGDTLRDVASGWLYV